MNTDRTHVATASGSSHRRRGYSLIESIVSIAILGVILTVTAQALNTMHRADRRHRDEQDHQNELDRLATQLRTDAHPARTATTTAPGDSPTADMLQLTLPAGQVIQYALIADGVERTLRQDGELKHREVYRLPPSRDAQWLVNEERSTPMISLALGPQPANEVGGPSTVYASPIDAAIQLTSPEPLSLEP